MIFVFSEALFDFIHCYNVYSIWMHHAWNMNTAIIILAQLKALYGDNTK